MKSQLLNKRRMLLVVVALLVSSGIVLWSRVPRRYDGAIRMQYEEMKRKIASPGNYDNIDSLTMSVSRVLPGTGPQRVKVAAYFTTDVSEDYPGAIITKLLYVKMSYNYAVRNYKRELLYDEESGSGVMLIDSMEFDSESATHQYFLNDGRLVRYRSPSEAYDSDLLPKMDEKGVLDEFQMVRAFIDSALNIF